MIILKAQDMAPRSSCVTAVAGPPGLGKSWFCGSVADVLPPEEVLLIATLSREVKSVKYQQHNLDTVICEDDEWEPHNKLYKSTGYNKLIEIIKELREDDKYSAVILDSGTEAGELAWHNALEPWKVSDTAELGQGNRFAPYTQLDANMDEIVRGLAKLAGHPSAGKMSVKKPKHVLITWHVQPPKEGIGDTETADQRGGGVEYEGEVLPMIRGRFRRRLMGMLDAFIYADRVAELNTKTMKTSNNYVLQINSTPEKHCKFPGMVPEKLRHIPNSFQSFIDTMEMTLELLKAEG